MSDLIRKRDAVSAISDLLMILDGKKPTWNEVYHAIQDLPSAEPEQKKGEWVVYEYPDGKKSHYIECNQCGKPAIWTNGISYKFPNFCPNCGADMRGDR